MKVRMLVDKDWYGADGSVSNGTQLLTGQTYLARYLPSDDMYAVMAIKMIMDPEEPWKEIQLTTIFEVSSDEVELVDI